MQKLEDDPYFENRQREERFVGQIVSEVGKAIIAEMPKFLASLLISLNQGYSLQTPPSAPGATDNPSSENTDFSAIDLDFIGG